MKRNLNFGSDMRRLLGGAIAGALLLSGCSLSFGSVPEASPAPPAPEPQIKTVRVEEIAIRDIGHPIEAAAEVEAMERIRIMVKQAGDVAAVAKNRGEAVQAGEVIVRLQSEELNRARAKAAADLDKARANLANANQDSKAAAAQNKKLLDEATVNWNRARNDYDLGLIGQAELDRVQAELERIRSEADRSSQQYSASILAYKAEVTAASSELEEIHKALSELEVKAPASGILAGFAVTPGMRLGSGAEVGFIEIIDSVKITAYLSNDLVKFVRGKQEISFYTRDAGQKSKASVVSLAEAVVDQKPVYELVLKAENPRMELQSGMRARIRITEDEEQNVVAVPVKGILYEDGVPYVFVAGGGIVEKRKVELGRLNEPYQEVLSGVKEKEWLVITGLSQLQDREKVQIQRQGEQP